MNEVNARLKNIGLATLTLLALTNPLTAQLALYATHILFWVTVTILVACALTVAGVFCYFGGGWLYQQLTLSSKPRQEMLDRIAAANRAARLTLPADDVPTPATATPEQLAIAITASLPAQVVVPAAVVTPQVELPAEVRTEVAAQMVEQPVARQKKAATKGKPAKAKAKKLTKKAIEAATDIEVLVALCKEHGIPANNKWKRETMVERLLALLAS